ncbi:MAG: hypothetical protein CMA15_06570 [Euryarchaeota archaeon]|nr:hypothetical protein [Euryarchaeota archaeon]|tara:strand:- start:1973 stop:2401 length:429 start_codon:yes stop_codon:yes gene_type:complete
MVARNPFDANTPLRELKNTMRLDGFMGLSMTTVQRMLGASAVASLGVWYLQGAVMDGVLTLVALCALTALVWGLSERESTFSYLKLTGSGPWNMLAMVASIVIFAQLSISIWAFPTVGAYILSLSFIGSFWLTGYMIQPNGV